MDVNTAVKIQKALKIHTETQTSLHLPCTTPKPDTEGQRLYSFFYIHRMNICMSDMAKDGIIDTKKTKKTF